MYVTDHRALWHFGLLFGLIGVVMLVGFAYGPGQDAAIFMVLGRGITEGDVPYLDLWDHKPPLIYLLAAVAHLIPGDFWGMFWLLTVASVAVTGTLLWNVTFRHVAILAAVLVASYPASQGGGMTETFALAFGLGAFILAERDRPFLAGVLAGLAVMTSLQLVALLPALLILNRRWLHGAAGFVVALVPVALMLDLPSAWDAVVLYSRAYLNLSRAAELDDQLPAALFVLGMMLVWAVVGRGWTRRQWAALAWLIAGLVLVALNGRLFAHYVAPLVIPAAFLAAPGLRRSWWLRKYAWPAAVAAAVGLPMIVTPWPY